MRYAAKWPTYAHEWDQMKIINHQAVFDQQAEYAIHHKAVYQRIEVATGVTWPHVAVLHRRESDANFDTYLGNGQSLHHVTTIVPKGRGPFQSFYDGALDALRIDGLSQVHDWRLEKILYYCEIFNGAGYDMRGLPSPYIWGGTNIQKPGKYVRDGVWSSRTWDPQPGCAPLLATIAKHDPSVVFVRET